MTQSALQTAAAALGITLPDQLVAVGAEVDFQIPGLVSARIRRLDSDGETAEIEIRWRRGADTAQAWRDHGDAILMAAGLLPAAWRAADGWETACGGHVVEVVTARRRVG